MDGYSKHDNHFSLNKIWINISMHDLPTIIGDRRDTLKKERKDKFAKEKEEKLEQRKSQKQRTKNKCQKQLQKILFFINCVFLLQYSINMIKG